MPACAEINNSMQQLTDVKYSTGEQHKDVTCSRVTRDSKDTQEVLLYLSQINPFTADASLRNIATGVTAPPSVNVHKSKTIGNRILASMEGESVASYIFREKNQDVTMETNSSIKIQDEHVHVDLFQRLVIIGTNNGEFQKVFDHELCQYPPALFDSVNSIRLTTKFSLADPLWCSAAAKHPGPSETVQYVLDGGALRRVPLTKGATYDQICEQYSAYVTKKYGKATVVFDGYNDTSSTKDCVHEEIT